MGHLQHLASLRLFRTNDLLLQKYKFYKLFQMTRWPTRTINRQLHICKKCLTRFSYYSNKSNYSVPVFMKAEEHIGRTAIIDQNGHFSYDDILHYSTGLSQQLVDLAQCENLNNRRVAFLCENDMSYVVTQWATWIAGGVAVPLSKSHPVSELEYFVSDSQSSLLVASEKFSELLTPIANKLKLPLKILTKPDFAGSYDIENNLWFKLDAVVNTKRRKQRSRSKGKFDDLVSTNKFKNMPAMIVYTSGTTGRPKGVLLSHGNLHAQMCGMMEAWHWSQNDVVLHVLPLHHVHGIVNVLMTPLFLGATCVMMPKFDPQQVWAKLLNPRAGFEGERINVFMAVPTIYAKLIEHYETKIRHGRVSRMASQYVKSMCQTRVRLMVSGSSALPQPIMEKWEQITGHQLLERYGMTETGMILTNPIMGPRMPGTVGHPMPNVEVCIGRPNVYTEIGYDIISQGDSKRTLLKSGEDYFGELLVRGPNVFREYWNKPEASKQAFTKNGWFKTGDTVAYINDRYKIIGRTSVDVIKSGGHKISALDVERHLLGHPHIADCAVIGLPDLTWGQRVAAILLMKPEHELSLEQLKTWAVDKLPSYEIPTVVKCVESLPRNVMGKVNKKELLSQVFPEYTHRR